MKLTDLDIVAWQKLVDEFKGTAAGMASTSPVAMRCENSQLSVGWKCGEFKYNGKTYKAFCPRAVHGPCAMLAVREDFMKWAVKRVK